MSNVAPLYQQTLCATEIYKILKILMREIAIFNHVADPLGFILNRGKKNIYIYNKSVYCAGYRGSNIDNIGCPDICNFANGLRQSAFTPQQINSSEIRSLDEM